MSTAKKPKRGSRSSSKAMDQGFVRTFAAIARASSQSPSLEMILTTTLEQTLTDPRLDAGEVYLLDEKTGKLNYACHRGLSEECVEEAKQMPIKLGDGIAGHVTVQREPIVVPELSQEPRFLREMLKKEGYRALISLPIKSGDRVYGVVNLFSRERQRFSARYVARLAAYMEMVGIALDYVQFFQEQQKAVQKLRFMFESIGDGIIATDLAGNIAEVNDAALHLTGYSREELIGRNALELISPKDRARAMEDLSKILEEGHARERVEYTLVAADGRELDVEFTAAPLRDSSGNPAGLIGIVRDITERKGMEEALRESEEKLRCMFESATEGITVTNLNGVITELNKRVLEMHGFGSKEQVLGKSALELIATCDRERAIENMRKTMEQGSVRDIEYSLLRADGFEFPAELSATVLRDTSGNPVGFIAVTRDITDRKRAEEELIRLSNAVRMSSDSIVISDSEANIIEVNEATLKMYGTDDRSDLVGKNSLELIAPEEREKALAGVEEVLENGYNEREYHVITKDGNRILVAMNTAIMKGLDGKPIGFVAVSRDITERKRMERALRQSEEQYRTLFESGLDGVFVIDAETMKIALGNERAAKMYGFDSAEDAPGVNPLDFVHPDDRERVLRIIVEDMFEKDLRQVNEFRTITTDGGVKWVSAVGTAIEYQGRPAGLISIADITERKLAEEALRESEERLRAFIENAPDAIYVNDLSGRFVDGNRKAEELIGYSREELIGKNFLEAGILPDEYVPKALAAVEKGMRGEASGPDEFELITKDGARVFVEVTSFPVARGGKVEVLGIGRDITERKRAEQQIIQHSKELEALYDVASAASQTLELEELLDNVLAKVVEVMEVDGGLVVLFIPRAGEFVLKAHRGISEELARDIARIKLQPQEIERAIQSEEPTFSTESIFNEAGAALFMRLQEREGLRSYTAVPLWSKGVLHGAMAIVSRSERRFTPENTGLLHAISNQIAVAIENASLFQDTKDKAERLAVTAELTRIMVSSLNIEEVFDAFAAGVRRLVDFDRASIALVEGANLRFLAVFSDVETELGSGAIVPLKDAATAWVVQNKRTNIETDFAKSMQFAIDETLFKSGLRSAIRLPLFYRGEVFGTFNLSSTCPNAYGLRELDILEELAGQIAIAIQNDMLFAEVKQRKEELEMAYDQLMATASALGRGKRELENAYLNMARTLVLTLEARDPYTRGHSERVAQISRQVAFEIGLSHDEMRNIETAARLHDLGKIGIPDSILLKPGPITPGERAEIQLHPTRAVELLRLLGFLNGVLPVIESHHERYNGGGYPESRKGEETPLGARILAVADAYDAMTSARPYRPPMSHEEAIQVLKEGAGKQWDAKVVDAFLRTFVK